MRISTQMKSQVFACLGKVCGSKQSAHLLALLHPTLAWLDWWAIRWYSTGLSPEAATVFNMGLSPGCWSLISELCPRLCYQIPLWVSAAPSVSWASLSSSQERDYSAKNSLFSKVGLFVTLFCEIRLSPCSS